MVQSLWLTCIYQFSKNWLKWQTHCVFFVCKCENEKYFLKSIPTYTLKTLSAINWKNPCVSYCLRPNYKFVVSQKSLIDVSFKQSHKRLQIFVKLRPFWFACPHPGVGQRGCKASPKPGSNVWRCLSLTEELTGRLLPAGKHLLTISVGFIFSIFIFLLSFSVFVRSKCCHVSNSNDKRVSSGEHSVVYFLAATYA